MSIQQLLAQLSGMGIGGFGATGGNIAGALGEQYGQQFNPQMFQTINPELIKSASLGAYSPLFQQKQSSLIPQLMSQLGGREARMAYGNFAGSGGAQMQQQQARDVYGKGMQDVLTQSMGAKTQSLGTIQDIINQWQATAQSFVG
jgi:hypothetical protein